MRKTILSIATCSLFLAGCFEKDDAVAPAAEVWSLAKFTTVVAGRTDTITTTVKLNADSKLTEYTESGIDGATPWFATLTATLEGNKLTQLKELRETDPAPRVINSLEYTGDKIERINYFGYNVAQEYGITGYHQMVYNEQGKLAEIRTRSVPNDSYLTFYKFTWEKDNVKSMTMYNVIGSDTSQGNSITFYYDAKPNILKPFFTGAFIWWDAPTALEYSGANNLVKKEISFGGELNHRVTFERTYNERNQVTQQKEISESVKEQVITQTKVTTFTYVKK